ncbi:hypothetical protein P3G55_20430 [Leptospira sp. 96542]|nr:hypothetical protein [Leptospira sp. 96542]
MLEKNVFKVLKFETNFDKEEYREYGYKQVSIPDSYLSYNKIEENIVYLNSISINSPKFIQSEFLVITHNINSGRFPDNTYYEGDLIYNKYKKSQFTVADFKFQADQNTIGNFQIYIDRDKYFHLGELNLKNKYNIKLNYKSDFSGSRRVNRRFFEEEYFISYLGDYSEFKQIPNITQNSLIELYTEEYKVIDIRKILV